MCYTSIQKENGAILLVCTVSYMGLSFRVPLHWGAFCQSLVTAYVSGRPRSLRWEVSFT